MSSFKVSARKILSIEVSSLFSSFDSPLRSAAKREAPQFTKRLEAKVYKTGSDVALEVEVSGLPQPEVKWLRNENDLKVSNRYRIQSSGNKHTLTMRVSYAHLAKIPRFEACDIFTSLMEGLPSKG